MNRNILKLAVLLAALAGSAAVAQESATADEQQRIIVRERAVEPEAGRTDADVEAQMRAAEARLEEAARRIAELSSQRLPGFAAREYAFAFGDRPTLGINIEADSGDGPVEGVAVRGVSPGGPAFDAGLRTGDVITAVDDQSLNAANSAEAAEKLLAYLRKIEGDAELNVEYLRDGSAGSVKIRPRPQANDQRFAFRVAPRAPHAPLAPRPHVAPVPGGVQEFFFWHGDGGWADMEMVPLTEGLGRYFGTDKGLLVVRAPEDDTLQLQDGDVIQSIDGREPESIGHAVRILGSYQPGESLEIDIMRDKRKRKLKIDIPDERQGMTWRQKGAPLPPRPAGVGDGPRVGTR